MHDDCINTHAFNYLNTCPDGAVAMSLANGLVGTGFVSPTQKGFLKAQWVGVRPLHPSLSLTSNRVTTNY